jgi:hypothetical protein
MRRWLKCGRSMPRRKRPFRPMQRRPTPPPATNMIGTYWLRRTARFRNSRRPSTTALRRANSQTMTWVGWSVLQLKVGSFSRSERMAKWNEALRIEEALDGRARFAGAQPWHGTGATRVPSEPFQDRTADAYLATRGPSSRNGVPPIGMTAFGTSRQFGLVP